ncbi:MAG: hypothetical protein USCGTAYLOR_02924 [Chromatiales bacterium USCg_Taylor]|nr:MAG: hypothetical protein USCGTAYLOR_02924 [Chromatiales bacterium USCg_Taylor]
MANPVEAVVAKRPRSAAHRATMHRCHSTGKGRRLRRSNRLAKAVAAISTPLKFP